MRKEQGQGGNLGNEVRESVRELLERSRDLTAGALGALGDDDNPQDIPTITAALVLSEGLNRTVREALGGSGEHVIFSADQQHPQDGQITTPEPILGTRPDLSTARENEDKPKTFGELLRVRIREFLPDQQEFTKQDIFQLVKNIRGAKKILAKESRRKFNKGEVTLILARVLTTPSRVAEEKLKTKQFYNQRDLAITFGSHFTLENLARWSKEIGHDWIDKQEVDSDTAMQIRGLGMLEKLKERDSLKA